MYIAKTKREINAYLKYRKTELRGVNDVYKNPSYYKQKAEADIGFDMIKYNGYDYKVITYTCEQFTAGFIGYVNGKKYFFYYTYAKTTITPLEEEI